MDPFWAQLRAWYFDRQRNNPKLFAAVFAAARQLWQVSSLPAYIHFS